MTSSDYNLATSEMHNGTIQTAGRDRTEEITVAKQRPPCGYRAMSACSAVCPFLLLPNPRALRPPPETSSVRLPRRSLLLLLPLPLSFLPGTSLASAFDPVTDGERDASAALSRRVSEAVRLLDLARGFQADGDFAQALDFFTQVVKDYKDFAFSDYARVGRALVLYEIGDREEAITEMEDVSISLKGYPEIHAALAAALYVDKHAPLLAENQFTIATLLDPHYTDVTYVKETKHWPPSLVSSLQHFLTLS